MTDKPAFEIISQHKCFDGTVGFYKHDSASTGTSMRFSVFVPKQGQAGRVPVFHTAIVERTFLGRELRKRRLRLPDDADTEVLGRLWLRLRDGVSPAGLPLARLAAVLGQPAEDPHHALGDALTTGKAFLALASHLQAEGYATVGALTHAEVTPARVGGRFAPG